MPKLNAFQQDVIAAVKEVAMTAVSHVGIANYESRETEARQWVRRACELASAGKSGHVIRHEVEALMEQKEPQA